ncbi:gp11 [Caballeronia arvi]|uniref:Gp11 n=1 Tax=Caballeronia arvi TaxID=1777135 RepID=A0A158HSY2_9BURK|nr:hypothetical protein [Caballeronia arvi]SAL47458.1 gp11 [Caballeronia arvi]
MASAVDICNLALGHLGDDATVSSISPPEGSSQAEHCQRFYPIARDLCLEAHEWGFATTRATLAALSNTPPPGFTYVYQLPSDCRNIVDLVDPNAVSDFHCVDYGQHWHGFDQEPVPYELETLADGTQVIYTNLAGAQLRYIRGVTDTTKFSAQFVDALAWLLAAYLAGPVIKGDTGMQVGQAMMRAFIGSISQAKTSDANNRRRSRAQSERNPSWIANR